ncbi:hypothetical protein ABZ370_03920 [Streptomyces sp. NPDC005962]|uniref:hypothetical protein n=1 Tax=Streptomyces sp. NPDC005962 TaxID=3154466 RepID=UPI0033D3A78F
MNQGLVALLGASVAVVGTLGTGGLTYIATRRQAGDQGEMEHRKQLREERRDSYRKFLEAAEPLDRAIFALVEQARIQLEFDSQFARDVVQDAMEGLESASHALYRERVSVALAGPDAVGSLAHELWDCAAVLQTSLSFYLAGGLMTAGEFEAAVDGIEVAKTAFVEGARKVLEAAP